MTTIPMMLVAIMFAVVWGIYAEMSTLGILLTMPIAGSIGAALVALIAALRR
jgi:hypothetical protein